MQLYPLIQIESSSQSLRAPAAAGDTENSFGAAFELFADPDAGDSFETPALEVAEPELESVTARDTGVLGNSKTWENKAPDKANTLNLGPANLENRGTHPAEMTRSPALESQPSHQKHHKGQGAIHVSAAQISLGAQMALDKGATTPVADSRSVSAQTKIPAQAGMLVDSDTALSSSATTIEDFSKSAKSQTPPVAKQDTLPSTVGVSVSALSSDDVRAMNVPFEPGAGQGTPQSSPPAIPQVVATTENGVARSFSPANRSEVWSVSAPIPSASSGNQGQNLATSPVLAPNGDRMTRNSDGHDAATSAPIPVSGRAQPDGPVSAAPTSLRGNLPDATSSNAPLLPSSSLPETAPKPVHNAAPLPALESERDKATPESPVHFAPRAEQTLVFRRAQAGAPVSNALMAPQGKVSGASRSDAPLLPSAKLSESPPEPDQKAAPLPVLDSVRDRATPESPARSLPDQTAVFHRAQAGAKSRGAEMIGTAPPSASPLVTASQTLLQAHTPPSNPPPQATTSVSTAVVPLLQMTISLQSQAVSSQLYEPTLPLGGEPLRVPETILSAKMQSAQVPSAGPNSQTVKVEVDPHIPASVPVAQRTSGTGQSFAQMSNPPKSAGVLSMFDTYSGSQRGAQAITSTGVKSIPTDTPVAVASTVPDKVAQQPTDKASPFGPATPNLNVPLDSRLSNPELESFIAEGRATAVSPATSHITPTVAAPHQLHTTVARQLADALKNGADRPIELTLSPAELGRVRMSLSASEAGVSVMIHADRPETLDLMRRNIAELDREFADMGYAEAAFSFSGGDGAPDQRDDSAPGQTNQPARDLPPIATQPETHEEIALSPSSAMDIRI